MDGTTVWWDCWPGPGHQMVDHTSTYSDQTANHELEESNSERSQCEEASRSRGEINESLSKKLNKVFADGWPCSGAQLKVRVLLYDKLAARILVSDGRQLGSSDVINNAFAVASTCSGVELKERVLLAASQVPDNWLLQVSDGRRIGQDDFTSSLNGVPKPRVSWTMGGSGARESTQVGHHWWMGGSVEHESWQSHIDWHRSGSNWNTGANWHESWHHNSIHNWSTDKDTHWQDTE